MQSSDHAVPTVFPLSLEHHTDRLPSRISLLMPAEVWWRPGPSAMERPS